MRTFDVQACFQCTFSNKWIFCLPNMEGYAYRLSDLWFGPPIPSPLLASHEDQTIKHVLFPHRAIVSAL